MKERVSIDAYVVIVGVVGGVALFFAALTLASVWLP
jgi:hypothetical protein